MPPKRMDCYGAHEHDEFVVDLSISSQAEIELRQKPGGAATFRYEREDQPLPRIGPWQGGAGSAAQANEGKAHRERLTLIRIFEALRGQGYESVYDAVRRYART